MEIKVNEEQLKKVGKVGLRIGKAIIVEGTKALVLKGAAVAITTSFEQGVGGVKNIKLDDVIGEEKESKGGLFKRMKNKSKGVVIEEVIIEEV